MKTKLWGVMTMISITEEEYNDLVRQSMQLCVLEETGVDNWLYFGDAMEKYYNELREKGMEVD